MTDKQIIIDGCDVSGCSYYVDGKCTNSHMIQSNCKNVVVCYYKEYKRKEQECEAYKMEAEEGKEINAELKAENDNLKSLIWWIHIGAEGADKATTEYYENRNTPYEENYWKRIRALQPPTYESKYKLALTEIKEIANKTLWTYPNLDDVTKYNMFDKILQKISECEVNDE